jgi:bisphosphoglycerate-independent phosphoglycerate mutase (AlkP superfamily)
MYVLYDPADRTSVRRDVDILDLAPTILTRMGLPVPADMRGRAVD